MTKTICKKKKKKRLKIQQKERKYSCKTCGETAHKQKYLCKPNKFKSAS